MKLDFPSLQTQLRPQAGVQINVLSNFSSQQRAGPEAVSSQLTCPETRRRTQRESSAHQRYMHETAFQPALCRFPAVSQVF